MWRILKCLLSFVPSWRRFDREEAIRRQKGLRRPGTARVVFRTIGRIFPQDRERSAKEFSSRVGTKFESSSTHPARQGETGYGRFLREDLGLRPGPGFAPHTRP